MPNGDMVEGSDGTRYYAVRLLRIVAAIAIAVSATTSAIATYALSQDSTAKLERADLHACEGRQALTMESNKRAVYHRRDAHNLKKLAGRLRQTRLSEAKVWTSIGKAFRPTKALTRRFAGLLKRAAARDREIHDSQGTVQFHDLPVPKC